MNDVEQQIRRFVIDNFLYGDEGFRLAGGESFMERGIIDSTGILELVAFLEETFDITLGDNELVPDNLDSVDRIVRFLNSKTQVDHGERYRRLGKIGGG